MRVFFLLGGEVFFSIFFLFYRLVVDYMGIFDYKERLEK